MKRYTETELQPLLDKIQEVSNDGCETIVLHIKDALVMAEHIRDLEELEEEK